LKESELVKQSELKQHLAEDPKTAHRILALLGPYCWRFVEIAPVTLTLTWDNSYHDVDVSANVSATAKMVTLRVKCVSANVYCRAFFRTNGSTADPERAFKSELQLNVDDSTINNVLVSGQVHELGLDANKIFEMKGQKSGGTVTVMLCGYWETLR
jgi:hypothetical protein